jgi:hypothetical protein
MQISRAISLHTKEEDKDKNIRGQPEERRVLRWFKKATTCYALNAITWGELFGSLKMKSWRESSVQDVTVKSCEDTRDLAQVHAINLNPRRTWFSSRRLKAYFLFQGRGEKNWAKERSSAKRVWETFTCQLATMCWE